MAVLTSALYKNMIASRITIQNMGTLRTKGHHLRGMLIKFTFTFIANNDIFISGIHFEFSFAVLQDAISIALKDVHLDESVLKAFSSIYFVLYKSSSQ